MKRKRTKKFRNLSSNKERVGIDSEEMAKRIGIAYNTYCQKERGDSEFKLSEAKIVADSLGKTIDEIFFGEKVTL